MSTCPPRIMAKASAWPKNEAPGTASTGSREALIRSLSSSPGAGRGPAPRIPFSDMNITPRPGST